jgi:hypothetical protein
MSMRRKGTVEYWLVWNESWGGSVYAICETAKTKKEAERKAKECEAGGGEKHRIVRVTWQ